MNLTASQIAEITAKVAANTQPTKVTLDGTSYPVPYRFVAGIKASRRAGRIDGSRGQAMRTLAELHRGLADALSITRTDARRIAQRIR
jgi:hypothetical protein